MRTTSITLVSLFCLALVPTASAGHGGGGGSKKTKVEGAGQRLHFSFGGKLKVHKGKITGRFAIVSHPLAPDSTRLTVSCRYDEFSKATVAGPRLEFDGKGKCGVLELDGDIVKLDVQNHFVIVDVPGGADQIDVEFIGESGIMIPGGTLEFGDFTMTTG